MASSRTGSTRAVHILASAGISLLAGACSQLGSTAPQLAAVAPPDNPATKVAAAKPATPPADNRSELMKATEYWGEAYNKNPRDAQTALNYARNLKALGEKRQALAVLQQVSLTNSTHRGINAEYGRLALEFDQVSLAQKLLEQSEDPTNPDWRIISARGTVLAKQGRYREVHFLLRARAEHGAGAALGAQQPRACLCHGRRDRQGRAAAAARGRRRRTREPASTRTSRSCSACKASTTRPSSPRCAPCRPTRRSANVEFVRSIVQLEAKPLATGSLPAAKDQRGRRMRRPKVAAVKPTPAKEAPAAVAIPEKIEPKPAATWRRPTMSRHRPAPTGQRWSQRPSPSADRPADRGLYSSPRKRRIAGRVRSAAAISQIASDTGVLLSQARGCARRGLPEPQPAAASAAT